MYKKVWCTCKVVVLLIKSIVFFYVLVAVASLDLKVSGAIGKKTDPWLNIAWEIINKNKKHKRAQHWSLGYTWGYWNWMRMLSFYNYKLCLLFSRKLFNHCNVLSSMPHFNILYSKPLWGTLSSALLKSITMTSVSPLPAFLSRGHL